MEADAFCSYTFQPSINPSSKGQAKKLVPILPWPRTDRGATRAPLHLRAEELRQRREERAAGTRRMRAFRVGRVNRSILALTRSAVPKLPKKDAPASRLFRNSTATGCTEGSENLFQPKISNRSERIVQKKRDMLYRQVFKQFEFHKLSTTGVSLILRRCASQGQVDCLRQLGPVEERLYAEASHAKSSVPVMEAKPSQLLSGTRERAAACCLTGFLPEFTV